MDTDTRDAYVERFFELSKEEKKYLKTMDTKHEAFNYLMLFKSYMKAYKGLSQKQREDYSNFC